MYVYIILKYTCMQEKNRLVRSADIVNICFTGALRMLILSLLFYYCNSSLEMEKC